MKEFRYERPCSLEQLKGILKANPGADMNFLAGGTDLLVDIRNEKKKPDLLIDLKGLPGVKGIDSSRDKLKIGALTTIHTLELDNVVHSKATALAEGASNLGSWQVRNRGTIGGNLGNGAPTADTASPLLALDATVLIFGPRGERRIPVESLWVRAGKISLEKDEFITKVEIPVKEGYSSAFIKIGPRNAMDIAIASVAVSLKLCGEDIEDIRIALGGAGPVPLRPLSAESYLKGKKATDENIIKAGELAASDSNPRSSSRASREYRLSIIPVITKRAILKAIERQNSIGTNNGGVV